MHRPSAAWSLALTALSWSLAARTHAETALVVVDVVKGDVRQGGKALQPGDRIGDQSPVLVAAGAWAALFAARSCARLVLRGPGRFQRQGEVVVDAAGNPVKGTRLSGCDRDDVDAATLSRLTRAGVTVVRDEQRTLPVVAGLPGPVAHPRPSLRVKLPEATAPARLRILDPSGKPMVDVPLAVSTLLPFPPKAPPLEPGATYVVDIVDRDGVAHRSFLRSVSEAERTELRHLAEQLDHGALPSLLYARVLAHRGLNAELAAVCATDTRTGSGWSALCKSAI